MDSLTLEPEDAPLRESRASSSSPCRADDVPIRPLALAKNEIGSGDVLQRVELDMDQVR